MSKFRKARCRVLNYNKRTHAADIDYKGHGLRITGVSEEDVADGTLTLMYCGKIGTPDFQYRLPEADADEPKVDIETPEVDIEAPAEDIETPDTDEVPCADIVMNE